MKRKILSLILSLAMIAGMVTVPASAQEGYNYLKINGAVTITGYEGSESDLSIPSEIEGLPVTAIAKNAFEKNAQITSVTIPEGVTKIGYMAFYQCENLESAVIPSTAEFVNESVGSSSLEPMFNYAFAECKALKNLVLTEGLTNIGGYAFNNCISLESVTIPSTITQWGHSTFEGCEALKDIVIRDGVTQIGSEAFRGTAVESVVIPSSIDKWLNVPKVNIGSYESNIFTDCENLSSVIFSQGLETIGQKAFENCVSLKKVVIPSSVKDISYAFENCTGLEEVAFEDNSQLSEFGTRAFSGCTNLKVLEIPARVTISTKGNGNLDNLISMETVYLYGNNSGRAAYSLGTNVNYYCIFDSDTYTTILNSTNRQLKIFDINEEVSKALGELKDAVDSAEKLNRERYTEESYSQLEEALEKAKNRNESSHISGIRASEAEIISAMENLEEKPEIPTSSSNKPTSASAPAKTSVSATVKAPTVAKVKKVKAVSKKKRTVKVTWKKIKGTKGYMIQISKKNNFKAKNLVAKKTLNKNSKKIAINSKKLKSGKKYFVRVRAYKTYTDKSGKVQKAWGSWSAKKPVKVK